jgi:uncharacterized protein involved in tolerance to divalent cations
MNCARQRNMCACRTIAARHGENEAEIRVHYPYATPEVIATPIETSSSDCLAWISAYSLGLE